MTSSRAVLVVVVMAVIASCAYYNIYWMAKDEYDKVISGPDFAGFWDPYDHKNAKGESARLIDSCTNRCGKLILLYPESKWVDDALLLMGNCFVLKGDYVNAAKKYDELLRLYAGSEFRDEARYMKAYNLILQELPQQALVELDDLLEGVTERTVRERATYLRARIYQAAGDCESAVDHLEAYISTFPQGARIVEVRLALGGCLIKIGRHDRAVEALEPLRGRPDDEGSLAGLQTGRAYRGLGQADKASEIFEGLAADVTSDTLKARALLEIANTLVAQNRPEEAVERLVEVDSLLGAPHGDLKAEAEYGMGIIYEKHIVDFDQATAAYETASISKSRFGRLASKRAKALKDLKAYGEALTDSIPDTPEERAMNMFLMAEIYLEDLGLRQEGFDQLKAVADSFPTTEFAAKSMLAVASLLAARQDTTALSYYQKVMADFPGTVYENVARARLSLPLVNIAVETPAKAAADTSAFSAISQIPTVPDMMGPPLPAPADTIGPAEPPSRERLGPQPRPDTSGVTEGIEVEPLFRDTTGTRRTQPGVIMRPEPEPRGSLAVEEEAVTDTLGFPAYEDSVGGPKPPGKN